ncbi:MAG: ABC transporter ATP-binding protein [Candidatus Magasanikbacteria bacterium]
MSLIDIKDLSVTYFLGKSNQVNALSNVDLEIKSGELVIFFGASGCGKSTLLYTIAGLEKPTKGKIMVNDTDLSQMKNKELEKYRQNTIGMVFQAFYLIPSLSVMDNITLPQVAVGINRKKRQDKAEELMKYFGVYEQRNKIPTELSGGQQQRVAICRSLINDPDIIFADEPVGNLDSKSSQDVLGLIQELSVKNKKTVILVTHDASHLDIADRIFFIKDGKIINTKLNKETRKIIVGQYSHTTNIPQDNTQNIGSTSENSKEVDDIILEYKAKEVISEVLTGFSYDEVTKIENYVKEAITNSNYDYRKLSSYLNTDYMQDGLNLNKSTSQKIIKKLESTTKEIEALGKEFANREKKHNSYVQQLRRYLLDSFEVTIRTTDAIDAMETIIEDRVMGVTDYKGVQEKFDRPVGQGGAGIDRRTAKKMAKHLEMIILGRYQNKSPEKKTQK